MFDGQQHNDWDLQMKSILEGGQEEVPAHIWDAVSSELDTIAQRRKTVIFWRRAAIGMSAAAALAFGLFLNHSNEEKLPEPTFADIVTPVFDNEISIVEEAVKNEDLIAFVPKATNTQATEPTAIPSTATEAISASDVVIAEDSAVETTAAIIPDSSAKTKEEHISTESTWVEEETELKERKIKPSIVLSGIAGTNSAQNTGHTGVIRRPTLSTAPMKTTVEQTEPGDTYGIPVSFGVGTKIGFNSRWSLGVGVNYTLLSRKFYGDYTKVEDRHITEAVKSDIRNTLHYVGIPINAYYNIVEKKFINFYAYAGGTVEKCVANEYRILTKDILHKEKVQGVQASANLGIGVEFMLGNHLGIYIDPSARYYFNCNQPKSIRTAQPLMLGFEMGFRVNL